MQHTILANPEFALKTVVASQDGGAAAIILCDSNGGRLQEEIGERVDALPERSLRALRQRAPYLVQGPALLDWRTLRENVAMAASTSSPAWAMAQGSGVPAA